MTIQEAIEINNRREKQYLLRGQIDNAYATRLGIDALKRESEYRLTMPIMNIMLLPGETTD